MTKQTKKSQAAPLIALLLAWMIPGAGHIYLGRTWRGVIIFLTIGVTFWAGVAIGGEMTVDKRAERWWFVAEICAGSHGLVGWHRSEKVYSDIDKALAADKGFQEQRQLIARRFRGRDRVAKAQLAELYGEYAARELKSRKLALVMPTETIARAYAGVAGLLNLMCVFDAVVLAIMGVFGETPPDRRKDESHAKSKGEGKKQ